MLTIIAIGVTMFLKDILGTGVIVFLDRQKPLPAGVCDAIGDVAAVFTYGVGGAAIYHQGLTLWSVMAILSMSVGSLAGTVVGFHLTGAIEKGSLTRKDRWSGYLTAVRAWWNRLR